MSPSDDIPDSTDWLSTPLSGLAAVEAALRCQVCKDFYKTPMITSCSHTFCSVCIRRALSSDGKCPLCRSTEQELKLRSNWSMEETVEAFSNVRLIALNLARNAIAASRSPKRTADDEDMIDVPTAPEPKRLRTSARLRSRGEEAASPTVEVEVEVVQESDDDYVPDTNDGLVPCPLCQKRMKEWQVFNHLESCQGPTTKRPPVETTTKPFSLEQAQRRQQTKLERLPHLNYSMLKDGAFRKRLGEMGISNHGPRSILEKRHKEWLTIWNANCDAAVPKTRAQLFHDLDVWERTQGGRAPTTGRAVQNAILIKDKDFDGNAWAAKHDASFKDLIANARKSRLEAKQKAAEGDKSAGNGNQNPVDVPPRHTDAAAASSSLLQNAEDLAIDDIPTHVKRSESGSKASGSQDSPHVIS
ncbi:Postreplication repair E3 ubiquitin-protein ligase rad18 [Cladobotryum mycophilum]|uniref:Postreplication repair E3 ubiquitin-protein ligase RAD18 n=1 Tax=Cladobotryum mycophilum TaxID=491253 RepID=A0ABR0T116_9HYPO